MRMDVGCYLILWIDEHYSTLVDGDQKDLRVLDLSGLLQTNH